MALFPLGILSAAGGADLGSYDLLTSQILGSGQSSILFSSLATYASDYKHLQIRATARSARSTSSDTLNIQLNGVSTSIYSAHRLLGTGSSVVSDAQVSNTSIGTIIQSTAANSTANAFSGIVMDILDPYSTTKNKTIRVLSGATAGANDINLGSGLFNSTASLTQIEIYSTSGNLVTGSRFSLYGIKG